MSSRVFRAASDDDDDAIFPNIEGLGVGDTGRPLGSGLRRAPPEDTHRRAAPPMERERARVVAGGTPGALDDMFVTRGVISKREGVTMTQQQCTVTAVMA